MNINPPMTNRGQKRRKIMINAAETLFLKNGFEATTLDMIIEQSGGSRSTLYGQFGGKEGIFSAVIESMLEDIFCDKTNDKLTHKSLEEILRYFGTKFINTILSQKAIDLYRLIVSDTPRFPTLGESFFIRGPQKSFTLLSKELMQLELPFDEVEIYQLSGQFLEMLKGELFIKALSYPEYQPQREEIDQQINLCVEMMCSFIEKKCSLKN